MQNAVNKFANYSSESHGTHTVEPCEPNVTEILAQGQVEEAFGMILDGGVKPTDRAARQMRAMIHLRRGELDQARAIISALINDLPDALSYKMMGDVNYLSSDYTMARTYYGKALGKNPNHPDILHDYGVTLISDGKISRGIEYMREAVKANPGNPLFRHHLSMMLCLNGEEKEGWKMMDARMEVPGVVGGFPRPECYWRGEDLKGKSIVLRTEQGFGDTILFMRYAKAIHDMKPQRIIAYCQPEMVEFIEHYYPYVEGWQHKAPPPMDFDYHINTMSLPNVFTDPMTVPAKNRHKGEGIGVCWFGSPTHKADRARTIPFEKFIALMDAHPNEKWRCAAYGFFDNKPPNIDYAVSHCRNWLETAQEIEKLDMLITVDTAIAHLGGFLGIPVWMLTPYVPDFRWGMKGERSKWYESVRLYRQDKLGDWGGVFERINADLSRRFGTGSEPRRDEQGAKGSQSSRGAPGSRESQRTDCVKDWREV